MFRRKLVNDFTAYGSQSRFRPTRFIRFLSFKSMFPRKFRIQFIVIIPAAGAILHLIAIRILMYHFMEQRFRYLRERTIKELCRHVDFRRARFFAVLAPYLAADEPTQSLVLSVGANRYYRLFQLINE